MKLLKQLLNRKPNKSTTNSRLAKGHLFEKEAEKYLVSYGLSTVERNFRCPLGEIDLIMQHNETLVFVEVRFRKSNQYSSASESVDKRKQRKLSKAAQTYLTRYNLHNTLPCRFDVVAFEDNGLQWIQNAFELSEQ